MVSARALSWQAPDRAREAERPQGKAGEQEQTLSPSPPPRPGPKAQASGYKNSGHSLRCKACNPSLQTCMPQSSPDECD